MSTEKLYHFTAGIFVPSILANGLTHGFVPVSISPPRLLPGYIWLTTSGDWAQAWAEGTGRLSYERNEVRITVEIPQWKRGDLLTWHVSGPILTPAYDILSCYGDPQNWRLFRGRIPPAWLSTVEHRLDLIAAGVAEVAL